MTTFREAPEVEGDTEENIRRTYGGSIDMTISASPNPDNLSHLHTMQ